MNLLPTEGPDDARGLEASPACSFSEEERILMERIARARPVAPSNRLELLLSRLPAPRPRTPAWWSAIGAAAAVFLLSLGGGALLELSAPLLPSETDPRWSWVEGVDEELWSIAGAPLLEELSDPMLLALLMEDSP
jgi:hypothetical protein